MVKWVTIRAQMLYTYFVHESSCDVNVLKIWPSSGGCGVKDNWNDLLLLQPCWCGSALWVCLSRSLFPGNGCQAQALADLISLLITAWFFFLFVNSNMTEMIQLYSTSWVSHISSVILLQSYHNSIPRTERITRRGPVAWPLGMCRAWFTSRNSSLPTPTIATLPLGVIRCMGSLAKKIWAYALCIVMF